MAPKQRAKKSLIMHSGNTNSSRDHINNLIEGKEPSHSNGEDSLSSNDNKSIHSIEMILNNSQQVDLSLSEQDGENFRVKTKNIISDEKVPVKNVISSLSNSSNFNNNRTTEDNTGLRDINPNLSKRFKDDEKSAIHPTNRSDARLTQAVNTAKEEDRKGAIEPSIQANYSKNIISLLENMTDTQKISFLSNIGEAINENKIEIPAVSREGIVLKGSLLHYFCAAANLNMIKILINLDHIDLAVNTTPLIYSPIVICLMAIKNPSKCKPEFIKNILLITNLLLQKHASMQWENMHDCALCFAYACDIGYMPFIELFIGHQFNVILEKDKQSSLYFLACSRKNLEAVKLLLKKNIPLIGNDMHDIISLSCTVGRTDILELLYQDPLYKSKFQQALNQVNKDDLTPLMLACVYGHFETVKFLLEKKLVNINFNNQENYTALLIACKAQHPKIIGLLLDHGADINALTKDAKAESPFVVACQTGKASLVNIFLHRADISELQMMEAFTIAFMTNRLEIINLLIAKIDVNKISGINSYSFMYQAWLKNKERQKLEIVMQDPRFLYEFLACPNNENDPHFLAWVKEQQKKQTAELTRIAAANKAKETPLDKIADFFKDSPFAYTCIASGKKK